MFFRDGATIHLRGWRRILAHTVWTSIVLSTLGLFIAALPVRYEQLLLTTPVGNDWNVQLAAYEAKLLSQMGISLTAYALYFITFECLFFLTYGVIGLMIIWRKNDEPLALFASLTLIVFGAIIPSTIRALDVPSSMLELPVHALQSFGWGAFFTCFYLFPDGRFIPRITRFAPPVFFTWAIISLFDRRANLFGLDIRISVSAFFIMFASGVAVQLYRYRYFATPTERQQTKWIVFAFAAASVGILLYIGSAWLFPVLQSPGVEHIFYHLIGVPVFAVSIMLIPIALGFSILRYRLWDIDILIRRTLIYGVLTIVLVLIYFASIVIMLALLGPIIGALVDNRLLDQTSSLVPTLATLAIAALFNPLRHRVQDAIDRRFYRQKYDAQQVLARFAATARDETDLQKLSEHLLEVVDEVMQPTSMSLWLKK